MVYTPLRAEDGPAKSLNHARLLLGHKPATSLAFYTAVRESGRDIAFDRVCPSPEESEVRKWSSQLDWIALGIGCVVMPALMQWSARDWCAIQCRSDVLQWCSPA